MASHHHHLPHLHPSNEEPTEEKPNCIPNFVSNCLLSSAFLQTPFLSPPNFRHSSSKPNPNLMIIKDIQTSLVSTADRFLANLNSVSAGNPVFQKLFSLSANLRNFCQMRCRNYSSSNSLSIHNFAAILPGDSVAGIVVGNGIYNFLNIYNTLLVVRLVLTWFPNSPPAIVSPLSTICDPYLNIFRGVIPPLGGTLDLSPILAFLVLNAFTSAASALPAELPGTGASQDLSSSNPKFLNLTTTQKKWIRRVCGNRSNTSASS
ncbi:Uncharacterized protein family Ycf19 [Macleaya cordata]|uniref:Uncharacterized protein family Ycf19 n=1 Tax=Macleaya cordata TaxID=56857 RepID=A0A200QD30_MACCD|nr:Uncharacterized protein family Ycf19 [Macleaya cordata]